MTMVSPWLEGRIDARTSTSRPRQVQGDAPVLGLALLGDVHPRHDLEARHQRCAEVGGVLGDITEHAVDAEAHAHAAVAGLDVDVRWHARRGPAWNMLVTRRTIGASLSVVVGTGAIGRRTTSSAAAP